MGILSDTRGRKRLLDVLTKHYVKLCVLSYVAGIIWLCALSDPNLNNRTYFSENALLPGMVQSDYNSQKVASKLYGELKAMNQKDKLTIPIEWLEDKMSEFGLYTYRQNFTADIPLPGQKDPSVVKGTNVYGVLRAPRISGTEAVVLSLPYRHGDNMGALALMLSLADHCRRYSYWSKDIIFLVTEEAAVGMQAWIEAYHDVANPYIKSLPIEGHSGPIQAAMNLEISTDSVNRFEILVEGINGQLPNLDLINMVHRLFNKYRVPAALSTQGYHPWFSDFDSPAHELVSMVMMMFHQASGLPTANHGLFHRFRIEAVTLRGVKNDDFASYGFYDMGRVMEGIYRSLNNLLERFHQSFFFYLLPAPHRYVSIGLYMPPFCCLLLGPLLSAIVLWALAGDSSSVTCKKDPSESKNQKASKDQGVEVKSKDEKRKTEKDNVEEKEKKEQETDVLNTVDEETLREKVAFAWTPPRIGSVVPVVMTTYLGGTVLYYSPYLGYDLGVVLGIDALMTSLGCLSSVFIIITLVPLITSHHSTVDDRMRDLYILKCVALILLSVMLASLATVNFSLAFLLAMLTIPAYLYVTPTRSSLRRASQVFLLVLASPPAVLLQLCLAYNIISYADQKDLSALATVTIETVHNAVVISLRDLHLLGAWSYPVVCIGVVPNWSVFWYLAWK